MAEDKSDKADEAKKAPAELLHPSVKIGGKVGVTAQVRVRLIQHSPDADPKLVEEVRKFERELKDQGSEDSIDPDREAPLILPVEK
jgi:hypothetical protein